MISVSDRYLLCLLKSVLNDQAPQQPPEGIDWQELLQTAHDHQVQALLLPALKLLPANANIPEQVLEKATTANDEARYREAIQFSDGNEALEALDETGIKCCALKGWNLRQYYPAPYLRSMSDLDLLVQAKDLPKVRELFESIGYTYLYNVTQHDVYTRPPFSRIEVHDSLMNPADPRCHYYDSIWEKLIRHDAQPHFYHMSAEDEFIYMTLHADKHVRSAGIGVRFVMDFYVFNHSGSLSNRTCIEQELKTLGLSGFAEKLLALSEFWFGEEKQEKIPDAFESYIFYSTLWGTKEQAVVQNFARQNTALSGSKFTQFFSRAFPSLEWMQRHYPILESHPILLPWYWLIRAVDYSKTTRSQSQFKQELQFLTSQPDDVVKLHQQVLDYLYKQQNTI